MIYFAHCESPVGELMLAGDERHVSGLWMEGQKYFGATLPGGAVERENLPVFCAGLFCGEKTRAVGSAAGSCGGSVPAACLENSAGNSLWTGGCLRLDRKRGGQAYGQGKYVQPGGGRRSGTQSHFYPHSLPQGGRLRWQPDRVCRRPG